MNPQSALVLEGGGMRSVFTAGVLDCLLDNKIYFPYVIGVSGGSSHGLSYVSRQRGRARACDIDELRAHRYIGLRFLFTQGCIMDYKYLFGDLPKKVRPYDFDTYLKCGKFVLVATNCLTGKAEYFDTPKTFDGLLAACQASCSLPYVCKKVWIDGVPYLDGGLADAIAQRRAEVDGFKKNLVVLTRNKGFRKTSMSCFLAPIMYRKYPKLVEQLQRAHLDYNENLKYIETLEEREEIVVIRPKNKIVVNRLERDCSKLERLYDEGYACAKESLEKINAL